MDTKLIAVALTTFVVGMGSGYVFAGDKSASHHDESAMHDQMDDMMAGLIGKVGDEFDRAFIVEMITHHEGAVEMAEAARMNAKHEEILQMADTIISAQTKEIEQMKEWQRAWYAE